MINLIANAIPFFLMSVAVEAWALRHHAHDHAADHDPAAPIGYETKDTRTSLLMGIGHLVIYSGWKLVMVAAYSAIYLLSPLHMDPGNWWVWVLLFFCDDLAYYTYHRAHHRIRVFWATHVVHHSSTHYNLSTALRQDWTPFSSIFFWAPLAMLGFPPWMIFLAISWNLLYQFWIHTEKIGRLPRWYEAVFNTPSHHRVHHGSNEQYLDRNYAGILIVWDRLFGSFEPERERVRYGLTTNIEHVQPAPRRLPRVGRRLARRPRRAHLAPASRVHVQGPRLATRPAGGRASGGLEHCPDPARVDRLAQSRVVGLVLVRVAGRELDHRPVEVIAAPEVGGDRDPVAGA